MKLTSGFEVELGRNKRGWRPLMRRGSARLNPRAIANLAGWYDVSDYSSLVVDGSNRVSLVADKSGNSAVNCLCLNGVAGNNATAPDSAALSITGDIDLQAEIAADDWNRAAGRYPISKYGAAGTRSYLLGIVGGAIELVTSADGTAILAHTSTTTVPFGNYSRGWIRATMDVNNGSGSRVVKFYTSTDGITWTQLGTTVTTAGTTNIFDSTSVLTLGQFTGAAASLEGRIYRARILNGYDGAGSVVFDANFALASKLATSFTESSSNAATVTINTSGATGARISGERDYADLTTASQPAYSATNRSVTGDGSNDFLRTPRFALPQAWTRISVIRQKSWVSGRYIFDGANGANSGGLVQTTSTPEISINAGSSAAANTGLAVDTLAAVFEEFNGASSSLQINRTTATTGNAGATAANGLTLFADGATTPANFGNAELCEQLVFSGVLDAATKTRIALYLGNKWGISL